MKLLIVVFCMVLSGCGDGLPLIVRDIPVDGTNGHNAIFSQYPANETECKNGGTILNIGTDLNDDNILQDEEITTVITTCDGKTKIKKAKKE